MDPKTSKQVLLDAREILVTKGWGKHEFLNDRGEYCALGALRKAAFGSCHGAHPWSDNHGAYEFARQALGLVIFGFGSGDIPPWNDAPLRTKEEVLVTFDKAIAQFHD